MIACFFKFRSWKNANLWSGKSFDCNDKSWLLQLFFFDTDLALTWPQMTSHFFILIIFEIVKKHNFFTSFRSKDRLKYNLPVCVNLCKKVYPICKSIVLLHRIISVTYFYKFTIKCRMKCNTTKFHYLGKISVNTFNVVISKLNINIIIINKNICNYLLHINATKWKVYLLQYVKY